MNEEKGERENDTERKNGAKSVTLFNKLKKVIFGSGCAFPK
jgi:hypothetical protein